jgi:hypothetical protein
MKHHYKRTTYETTASYTQPLVVKVCPHRHEDESPVGMRELGRYRPDAQYYTKLDSFPCYRKRQKNTAPE